MSINDDEAGPSFDEQSWERLYRQGGELPSSEKVNGDGDDDEEVPVFTGEFWDGVYRRAERIRNLPVGELPGSEELHDDDEESGRSPLVFPKISQGRRSRAGSIEPGRMVQPPPPPR